MKGHGYMRKNRSSWWLKSGNQLDMKLIDAGYSSRKDLAVKNEIDYSLLTHFNIRPISINTAYKIAKAVNQPIEKLFAEKTAKK